MFGYRILFRTAGAAVVLLATAFAARADDNNTQKATEPSDSELTALERQFEKNLSGSVLVGRFSVDGKQDDGPGKPERYEIESVKKFKGDYWVFTARIKYAKRDVKIPMTLKVLWAGDTPMITLTDFTIPGLGTFTCRVFFHGTRYAGTWQHGEAGGHMWGQIERAESEKDS